MFDAVFYPWWGMARKYPGGLLGDGTRISSFSDKENTDLPGSDTLFMDFHSIEFSDYSSQVVTSIQSF